MQDDLTLVAMILLIISNGFLIFGCREIQRQLPQQSTTIQKCMGGIQELMDEALDMIDDLGGRQVQSPIAGSSIQEVLLANLMNRMTMASEHGSKEVTEEREIPEIDPSLE